MNQILFPTYCSCSWGFMWFTCFHHQLLTRLVDYTILTICLSRRFDCIRRLLFTHWCVGSMEKSPSETLHPKRKPFWIHGAVLYPLHIVALLLCQQCTFIFLCSGSSYFKGMLCVLEMIVHPCCSPRLMSRGVSCTRQTRPMWQRSPTTNFGGYDPICQMESVHFTSWMKKHSRRIQQLFKSAKNKVGKLFLTSYFREMKWWYLKGWHPESLSLHHLTGCWMVPGIGWSTMT